MRALALLLAIGALPGVEFTFGSLGGSPIPIGAGARALGMGGAFSAIADDATAATWNPAGVAQLERPELSLSGGYYHIDSGEGDNDDIELDHVGGVLPFYLLGLQQAVGLSWQRRFDLTVAVDYGAEIPPSGIFTGGQSEVDFEREGGYAAWSLSYGVAVSHTVNLGLAVDLWSDELTGASASDGAFRNTTINETSSTRQTVVRDQSVDEVVEEGVSIAIGAQWRALPELTLSAVVKPGFDLEIEQRTRTTNSTETRLLADGSLLSSSSSEEGGESSYDFEYPTSATIGGGWRPNDSQTVTMDLTWTRWSEFAVTRNDERVSAFSNRLEPGDVDDDFAVRIGYEHVVILPRWVLAGRAGLLYERLPGLDVVADVNDPGEAEVITEHWFGASFGLSAYRRSMAYDAAIQVRGAQDVGAGVYAPPDERTNVVGVTVRLGAGVLF